MLGAVAGFVRSLAEAQQFPVRGAEDFAQFGGAVLQGVRLGFRTQLPLLRSEREPLAGQIGGGDIAEASGLESLPGSTSQLRKALCSASPSAVSRPTATRLRERQQSCPRIAYALALGGRLFLASRML